MHALARLQSLSPQRRIWWMVGVWLIASLTASFLEEDANAFRYFERYFDNARMAALGETATTPSGQLTREWARQNIVQVQLTDESFQRGGAFEKLGTPPLPRRYHAQLLRSMKQAGAKVVAFDFVFESPTPDDEEFAAAAKAHGRVVWATVLGHDSSGNPRIIEPVATLKAASPYIGHIQVPQAIESPEVDSITPLYVVKGQKVPAFSLQVARLAAGLKDDFHLSEFAVSIGALTIPPNRSGRTPILYYGRPVESEQGPDAAATQGMDTQAFATIPYETALEAGSDPTLSRFFRDKVVIVGDTTQVSNDFRRTPAGYLPGMEIHAHAAATLWRGMLNPGEFVHEAPPTLRVVLVILAGGLTAWACTYLPLLRAVLGVLIGAVLYGYANVLAFNIWRVDLPLLAPLFALFGCVGVLTVQRGLVEERAKNEARQHLSRFLSPQVAEYVLANPEKCALGGERVTASVLFADIRDFTPLSERMAADEVVALLNDYLTEMTAQILEHDGTLDKFIGDAIMAFWGAPVRYEDHAWRAVSTALDMAAALEKLQDGWSQRGLPQVEIGIGINSGEMVIGEMGAQAKYSRRAIVNFTAIGDAVNLASRVEGLNKSLGTRILITEATYRLVKYKVLVRGPFETQVKGKRESILVYEVYGRRSSPDNGSST